MKKIIEVTQADIDAGKRKDCDKCPVAVAMIRAIGQRAIVGIEHACILPRDILVSDVEILLPDAAAEFILGFDAGRPVSPFTFELEVPDAVLA